MTTPAATTPPVSEHFSTRALSALDRGEPRDPESLDIDPPTFRPDLSGDRVCAFCRCPACKGNGHVLEATSPSPTDVYEVECTACDGKGHPVADYVVVDTDDAGKGACSDCWRDAVGS